MKKKFALIMCSMFMFIMSNGCGSGSDSETVEGSNIRLRIDDILMSVTWENNDSVRELKKLLTNKDLVINMNQYGGFEQVGSIGQTIKSDNREMTTYPGDIVLYSGNQIVIFYGSNSWSYTKLGKLIGKTDDEIKNILDKSGVKVRLSLSNSN